MTDADYDADPQSDWWVPADIAASEVADFYRRVAAFSDDTIAGRDLDAAGSVPWWPQERCEVSLARVVVHVISDTTRHAGHADILRETIDGIALVLLGAGAIMLLTVPLALASAPCRRLSTAHAAAPPQQLEGSPAG